MPYEPVHLDCTHGQAVPTFLTLHVKTNTNFNTQKLLPEKLATISTLGDALLCGRWRANVTLVCQADFLAARQGTDVEYVLG